MGKKIFFVCLMVLILQGMASAEETPVIKSMECRYYTSDNRVEVTVNASSSTQIYYKFYYCGNYGTSSYADTPWTVAQEYSSNNKCMYSFPDSGNYVVVARAVSDPDNEPAALPIIGGVVTTASDSSIAHIGSISTESGTGQIKCSVTASTFYNNSKIYYAFYYCPDYGTPEYDPYAWTMVQDYSTNNQCNYSFPDTGRYLVVARAVTDPFNEPAALPIAGLVVFDSGYSNAWSKKIFEAKPSEIYLDSSSRVVINSTASDSRGNIYLAGTFYGTIDFNPENGGDTITAKGNGDVFLKRVNSDGTYAWTKTFGSRDEQEGICARTDKQDNVYICGKFTGTVDFNPGNGEDLRTSKAYTWQKSNDAFITKINNEGNYLWTKTFGASWTNNLTNMTISSNNSLSVSGHFIGENLSENNIDLSQNALLQFTTDGTFIRKIAFFSTNQPEPVMIVHSMCYDSSGNCYVTGEMSEATLPVDFGSNIQIQLSNNGSYGERRPFIIRINSDGTPGWRKVFNISDSLPSLLGNSIITDSIDNVYVSGLTHGNSHPPFVVKFRSDGTQCWGKNLPALKHHYDYIAPQELSLDASENPILATLNQGLVKLESGNGESISLLGFDRCNKVINSDSYKSLYFIYNGDYTGNISGEYGTMLVKTVLK